MFLQNSNPKEREAMKAKLIAALLIISAFTLSAQDVDFNELTQPGPEHEMLAEYEGDWKIDYTMKAPSGDSTISYTGTTEIEMILGGRFQKWHSTGSLLGQEFESFTFIGFDRRTEEYSMYVIDTYGTYDTFMNGKFDEASNTVTFNGEFYFPGEQQMLPIQIVLTFLNESEMALDLLIKMPDQFEFTPHAHHKITRD